MDETKVEVAMTEKKVSFWTRLRWAFVGKPVTLEEQRAARQSRMNDPMTDTQLAMRNQRFEVGGF